MYKSSELAKGSSIDVSPFFFLFFFFFFFLWGWGKGRGYFNKPSCTNVQGLWETFTLILIDNISSDFSASFLFPNRPFSHCLCACVYRSRGALFLDNRRDFTEMGQTDFKGLLHCFSTCIEIIGNNWYCFILKNVENRKKKFQSVKKL